MNDDDDSPVSGPVDRPHSPIIPSCGKVGHPSRRRAIEARNEFVSAHDTIKDRRPALRVFRCQTCLCWHLGNSDPMVSRQNRSKRGRRTRKKRFEHNHGEDDE